MLLQLVFADIMLFIVGNEAHRLGAPGLQRHSDAEFFLQRHRDFDFGDLEARPREAQRVLSRRKIRQVEFAVLEIGFVFYLRYDRRAKFDGSAGVAHDADFGRGEGRRGKKYYEQRRYSTHRVGAICSSARGLPEIIQ